MGNTVKSDQKLGQMIEDYALEPVPANARKSWPQLAIINLGVVTSLVDLMIGGIVTFMAGFFYGLLAGIIALIIGAVLTYLIGTISLREGLSSNMISRAYAFGTRGSALASAIYCFMLIGFLGLEGVMLGTGIVFFFHLPNTLLVRIILYGSMGVVWTLLSLFGIRLVTRVAQVAVPALILALLVMIAVLARQGHLVSAFTHGIMVPGMSLSAGFAVALNSTVAIAGLLALFTADFARYARNERDMAKIAVAGSAVLDLVTLVAGAVITYLGFSAATNYFQHQGMPLASAAGSAITSPAITFVLLGGFMGLIVILLSQVKVEVMNSYSSSLSLANMLDAMFGWKPGRGWTVIMANAIALVFIFGGILSAVNNFLTLGSVLTASWAVLMVMDYYVVRRAHRGDKRITRLDQIEAVNWAGVLTVVVSTGVSMALFGTGHLGVPFLLAVPMTIVLYPLLRSYVIRGKGENEASEHQGA